MSIHVPVKHSIAAITVVGMAIVHPLAWADDEHATGSNRTPEGLNDLMGMDYQKSMKMDAPMPTGMAKPGMTMGDVKARAEKRELKLEKMMQEEMK
jgi:hypothetical protein